jgi:GNAT superfamily N-acetyltransferase
LSEHTAGNRSTLVAEVGGDPAGYVTVVWVPEYPMFKERSIPEIDDLNVLVNFQKRGVGTRLMETAEQLISQRSDMAGIRVGLDADYGNAQHLYIKRGYQPDGLGISQRGRFLKYGDTVTIDDDLTLGLTKSLK